jgi:mono/diheme cytochrome c family protein
LTMPVLKDMENRVADLLGATRTPEVFVLDQDRVVRYAGRVDDQYGFKTGAGYAKPRLARRDLAEAIDELLAGKEVSHPAVKADGCLIGRVKRGGKGEVTYSNQISRILQAKCQECHRPGELAPFAMENYDEIVGWAETIREVVYDGRMPPWFANPAHGKFVNDPRLTDEEKGLISAWVANGCPEGDKAQLPPKKEYFTGWKMGEPDQIIYVDDKPYDVPAEGVVSYKYFTVDPGWKEDKWIQVTECRPGNAGVVHHIICFIAGAGASPVGEGGGLGGYAPGNSLNIHAPGTAIKVPANSKLVFQMHYTPNGTAAQDRSMMGVKFADPKTIKQQSHGDLVGNLSLKIPANDPNYEVTAKHRFRRDMLMLNMTPHMHLRGKDFRFVLEYPNGDKEILLDVPKWDFNWQLRYEFAEPKLIPKGATLHCIAHYDNSSDNPANPDPTTLVKFGDQTWEEMMFGFYASIDPKQNLLDQKEPKLAAGDKTGGAKGDAADDDEEDDSDDDKSKPER